MNRDQLRRYALMPLLGIIFLGPGGCKSRPKPSDEPTGRFFVYVSVGNAKKITVFQMAPATGALAALHEVKLEGEPGSLAVDPQQQFLYAALRDKKAVTSFRIDPDSGNLQPISTVPLVDTVYLAVDGTGKHLLMASYNANKVAVYPIGSDGAVKKAATTILETEKNPHSIMVDRFNRHVYVPNTGADSILQYELDDRTGNLLPAQEPLHRCTKGAGPRHFFFHPTKPFVYFVNEHNSTVTAYARTEPQGALHPLQTLGRLPSEFTGSNTCADIEMVPSGRFLYASNRGHDSIAAFQVDRSSGRIRTIGRFATEKTPRSFTIDPSGRFLFSAGQGSGRLAAYRIDHRSGALVPHAIYPVGPGPAWVLALHFVETVR